MFKPSEFSVGGGLLDDVDVEITEAKIAMFDYDGKQAGVPAIMLSLLHGEGETVEQAWSVGNPADFQPSEDGKTLVQIGRRTQINASSNGAILLKSIVDAGFPEDKIDNDDIGFLVGVRGHVMRVPAPVRKGLTNQKEGATILTFATITKFPWDTEKAATKAKPGPKPGGAKAAAGAKAVSAAKEAPPAEESGEKSIEEETQEILLEVIADGGDAGVAKAQLPGLIMKKAAANPKRKEIIQLAFKDDFLKSGPWTYAGGKLSL